MVQPTLKKKNLKKSLVTFKYYIKKEKGKKKKGTMLVVCPVALE